LAAIIARYGLRADGLSPAPWVGGCSCIYQLGPSAVLKVPDDDPSSIASMAIEAAAASAAHQIGVRTPRCIAFDDSLDLLPVPYLVFERIEGEPLSRLQTSLALEERVWREVGANLAVLHTGIPKGASLSHLPSFPQTPKDDPRPWVADVERLGVLNPPTSRWLRDLLDRLARAVLRPGAPAFCHGDVNAANVMVRAGRTKGYAALLDWGGAGWADPAGDFSAMPLVAVPFALAGYRRVGPMMEDETAEARILWFYLRLALFGLRRATVTEGEQVERAERLVRDVGSYLSWARLP
jgi:aminoglycoside phosphotransferase (APT) family kinase protein